MSRRAARERAVAMLYEGKIKQISPENVIAAEGESVVDPLTIYLVRGVAKHQAEIDAMIAAHSSSREFSRVALLNVCILEIGVFELLVDANTAAVVINEAVELAKKFSDTPSARFINGMLSAVSSELAAR